MLQLKRFHLSLLSLVGADSVGASESHIISGPLGQQTTNLNAKKKRNPSVLAAAFQNAWKQGNLAAEVRRGRECEEGGRDGMGGRGWEGGRGEGMEGRG